MSSLKVDIFIQNHLLQFFEFFIVPLGPISNPVLEHLNISVPLDQIVLQNLHLPLKSENDALLF